MAQQSGCANGKYPKPSFQKKELTLGEKLLIVAQIEGVFDFEPLDTDLYSKQMKKVIYCNFPMMNRKDLASLMRQCDLNYIKTYACIMSELQSLGFSIDDNGDMVDSKMGNLQLETIAVSVPSTGEDKYDKVVFINMMEQKRTFSPLEEELMEPRLKKEIGLIKKIFNPTKNMVHTWICAICCRDCPTSEMIRCTEGHEVCRECLSSYLNESIFGLGKMELKCMMECEAIYSRRQVEIAVSSNIMKNYDKRVIEENLSQAGIENVIQCPDCGFTGQLDDSALIFNCLNCSKLMCKYCFSTIIDEEWDKHLQADCIGKELDKVKDNRITFEERMSALMIRICPNCGANIVKNGGCNHIKCKCGTDICYICKQQFKNIYMHFARSSCTSVSSPEKDEENAILELKKNANKNRKILLGVEDDKVFGVPTKQEERLLRGLANQNTHPPPWMFFLIMAALAIIFAFFWH